MSKANNVLSHMFEKKLTKQEILGGQYITPENFNADVIDALYGENSPVFTCDWNDIKEVHCYNTDSIPSEEYIGTWPTISKEGNLIKLESSFGHGKESYILCKRARITEL